MIAVLLMLICGAGRGGAAIPAKADRIEINIVQKIDEKGNVKDIFRQVVIWRWHSGRDQMHVSEWFMAKEDDALPYEVAGVWHFRYRDLDGRMRTVVAPECFTSRTFYDVEREDQSLLPEQYRSRLPGRVRHADFDSTEPEAGSILEPPIPAAGPA